MAKYDHMLFCPSCGTRDLNLANFTSLMVLKDRVGLFTIMCPTCHAKVTSIQAIPDELAPTVAEAAEAVGAGMGHSQAH